MWLVGVGWHQPHRGMGFDGGVAPRVFDSEDRALAAGPLEECTGESEE